jgi:hypothetical protein
VRTTVLTDFDLRLLLTGGRLQSTASATASVVADLQTGGFEFSLQFQLFRSGGSIPASCLLPAPSTQRRGTPEINRAEERLEKGLTYSYMSIY